MTEENKELPARNRPAATKRKTWLGIIYGVLALIFAILTFALGINDTTFFLIFGLPALFLGRSSVRHLKRRYTSDELMEEDLEGKTPVLFLRPFDTDGGWDGAAPFEFLRPRTWRKFPFSPTNMKISFLQLTGRNSFEQVLAYVTKKIGPMIAVGQPESPPILGAKNVYLGDDSWKGEVLNMAKRSQLVVLTTGITPGVLWEVRNMLETVPPQRLLLSIYGNSPRKRKKNYAAFIENAQEFFPAGLPEDIDGDRFLTFDESWKAERIPHRSKKLEKLSSAWVGRELKKLLI